MPGMLKVYGRRSSANVQKVMWLVDELALPHEHIPAGGSFGGLDTPEFRALNPNGKVPAIDDQGVAVWESHAILRYLAARYAPAFFPVNAAERARIEPWMDWSQTTLQPNFLNDVFWAYYRTPGADRSWTIIRAGQARTERDLKLLDARLARQPYLAGDSLSLADIPAGTLLYRYFTLDLERPSLPHVEAWYQRLQARPAYRAHVMIAYDELKGRLAF